MDSMNSTECAGVIASLIEDADLEAQFAVDEDGKDINVARVETYEDAGILTADAGFVLKLSDGSEFQITVKRSN
jgi:hypothetical protein